MSSERDQRQRQAARARLAREMAQRLEAARRRRLRQAWIGAGTAAVVLIGAVIWIVAATVGGEEEPVAGPPKCVWIDDYAVADNDPNAAEPTSTPSDSVEGTAEPSPTPSLPEGIRDVGHPPEDVPRSGYRVFTFETNLGTIKVQSDLSKTPCTAASMAFLADQGFFDGTTCHRLVPGIFVLQCGDPSGTGSGGVTYRFADEALPTNRLPAYRSGDVAMANTGYPSSNSNQFFFLWENSPNLPASYTPWGRVIEGLDIVREVGEAGDDGAFAETAGGGHPNKEIKLLKVTASPVMDTPVSIAPAEPTASPTS